jgi:hypothetical protein
MKVLDFSKNCDFLEVLKKAISEKREDGTLETKFFTGSINFLVNIAFHYYHDMDKKFLKANGGIYDPVVKRSLGYIDEFSQFSVKNYSIWIKLIKSINAAYSSQQHHSPTTLEARTTQNLNFLGNLVVKG